MLESIQVKQVDSDLFEIVRSWWAAKNCQLSWAQEILPEGFMSFIGGRPVCSGHLYHQGTTGWLAWLSMNPEASSEERELGMKALVEWISKRAAEKGIKFIVSATNNASLLSRLEANGFTKYDTDVVHLLKIIKEDVCHHC